MRRTMAGNGQLFVRAYRPLVEGRTWRAVLFHLTDLPVAWLAGALLGAVVGTSVLLAPLALLVIAAALVGLRRLAGAERWRARVLLGVEVQAPPHPDRGSGVVEWVATSLRDRAAWRVVGYLLVRFVLGNAAFVATVYGTWLVLGAATLPLWLEPSSAVDVARVLDTGWEQALATAAGLLGLALLPRMVTGFARLSGWAVETLLGTPARERIAELEVQRTTAVRAADVDRRRIEQDLHDGAQVRLTALAMHLGLAREAIREGADPGRVADLVDEAHEQAKVALREIRDLARGIHPAILTDRGLEIALQSMVGRLPIPVELEVEVADRPAPEVESIAYFVAAEGVTNAVRHADSPSVGLRVVREQDEVVVEVRDRGRGGADPLRGTGLANLRERVEATGGTMAVTSPEGVGTLLRAVVPCGS